ncbi:MAG: SMI1/KNR4 family protein [Cellvibrionaceae bacterium]
MKFQKYFESVEKIYHASSKELTRNRSAKKNEIAYYEEKGGHKFGSNIGSAWMICNGTNQKSSIFTRPGYLTGFYLLSIEASIKERSLMKKRAEGYKNYVEPNKRNPKISGSWYEEGWIPFGALNGGSSLLICDMSPADRGSTGQIICYTHDPDEIVYIAKDFSSYLKASLKSFKEDKQEFLGIY